MLTLVFDDPREGAPPAIAHIAQYETQGRNCPEARGLGAFSSGAAAHDALRAFCAQRPDLARA